MNTDSHSRLDLNDTKFYTNTLYIFNRYLSNICKFSFEINKSRLSDTRCLIQDVVSPHYGDKRKTLPNYFVMTSYHWNVRHKKTQYKRDSNAIRLFRIISIPSKFCYFRLPDHVILMAMQALDFRCQCTQQKLQSI